MRITTSIQAFITIGSLACTSGLLVAFGLFAPVLVHGESSCSGTNYFSCVTGGNYGSVGTFGTGAGILPLNIVNNPTPGGSCSCGGCLCVESYNSLNEYRGVNNANQESLQYNYASGNLRLTTTAKEEIAPVPASARDARKARSQPYWDGFYEGFYGSKTDAAIKAERGEYAWNEVTPIDQKAIDAYEARPTDSRATNNAGSMVTNVTNFIPVTVDKWGSFYNAVQESALSPQTIREENLNAPGR